MNTCKNDRVILHCDMNGFYAAVELLAHPELAGRPMAVSGDPDNRHGIILAKNQLAKEYGVVTAETIWKAKKKCPDLVLVKPHMDKYKLYCGKINSIYQRFTDMVEPFSIDESWLDVTASQSLFGSGRQIADTIRKIVKEELGMTLSAGVSYNKVLAKMGSEYKKPDATTIITKNNFREILWPLPARELFGVGKATSEKLDKLGIRTIGDIARADKNYLHSLFRLFAAFGVCRKHCIRRHGLPFQCLCFFAYRHRNPHPFSLLCYVLIFSLNIYAIRERNTLFI